MRAFEITTANGKYIVFAIYRGQAVNIFNECVDEEVEDIYEVDYTCVYILNKGNGGMGNEKYTW